MAKYLKRLSARLAMDALRESAKEGKNWIATKKIILEADDMDVTIDKGDSVEVGATQDGDLAIGGKAAVVVIADADLAKKVADVVVSADELSDVKFVDKPALDAMLGGEDVEDVIDDLAGAEGAEGAEDTVEVPEVDVEAKESVEAKFAKFAENVIDSKNMIKCESILVDEEDTSALSLYCLKKASTMCEAFDKYEDFAAKVSEMKGSLQPGKREFALSEAGKFIGSFDKEAGKGMLYLENEFDSAEAMDSFDAEPAPVMQDVDLGETTDIYAKIRTKLGEKRIAKMLDILKQHGFESYDAVADDQVTGEGNPNLYEILAIDDKAYEVLEEFGAPGVCEVLFGKGTEPAAAVESCLKKYEESAKTGADYMNMVRGLCCLTESMQAKIVATFDNKKMGKCVRVFDSKLGRFVGAFEESCTCDNFIEETKDAKRFSKRFFA